jgi:putative hydrolase of the HAD superfamily
VGTRFDALIVDFGGVLTSPLHEGMLVLAHTLGIELQDLVRVALRAYAGHEDELVHGLETGHIPEDEFAVAFAKRLEEETGTVVDPVGLVDRIFSGLSPEESMFDAVLRARRGGFKTALCSNSWGLGVYPRERFPEMFDVVIISGEVGLRKPDRAIFDLTVEQLGVEPSRAVFVDDHPGHLKAAAETGMTTVLHRTPHETIDELEKLLEMELSGSS